jgi:O-antigen/teichoic acid export membrane protein
MTFYNRIDAVMLERMLDDGAEQSGIYAKAFRLLDATNMVAYLFAGLLLPMFARMIKQKQSVEELVKLSFSLLMVPAVIAVGCAFFYALDIMKMLYKNNIEESATVFGLLMSCFVAVSTTYIFGTLLTANGNLKELNLMAALGMLLNISLNIVLIPLYKASGSAFSSLLTQFTTALLQVFIAQRVFKFKINYRFLFVLAAFVCGTLLMGYFSTLMPFTWGIRILVFISAAVLWAFTIRIVSIRSVYNILKYG